ncbi:hypothetical protein BpHYR1_011332 [Brachionus plicatilis]|uniref:Uncharacterized protein n=1 Tax=Brachionus plicatilis TaxID=10195 RepID=A0A3M7SK58_BRAPC|nr:hypothetical protein BpHYR1_011332 [Brachionus plicatilis]
MAQCSWWTVQPKISSSCSIPSFVVRGLLLSFCHCALCFGGCFGGCFGVFGYFLLVGLGHIAKGLWAFGVQVHVACRVDHFVRVGDELVVAFFDQFAQLFDHEGLVIHDVTNCVRNVHNHLGEVDPGEFGVATQMHIVGLVEQVVARKVHAQLEQRVRLGVYPFFEHVTMGRVQSRRRPGRLFRAHFPTVVLVCIHTAVQGFIARRVLVDGRVFGLITRSEIPANKK